MPDSAHSFVISFIANMAQLDAAIGVQLPAKMAQAVKNTNTILTTGMSQNVKDVATVKKGMDNLTKAPAPKPTPQPFAPIPPGQIKTIKQHKAEQDALAASTGKVTKAQEQSLAINQKAAKQLGVHPDALTKSREAAKVQSRVNQHLRDTGQAGTKAKKGFTDAFTGADSLSSVIGKVALWTIATGAVFGMVRAVSELTQRNIELEKHFADLKRVIDATNMDRITTQVFGMAHAFGVATTDVIDATFEWGKTTRSMTDIVYGQQASILAVKVGEMELADSTKYLTALYHSMGLRGQELIDVVDQLNALQNKYGANISGTMEVLARSGGIIKTYGGDLRQTMALSAAALKMTGEQPSKVATLFRRLPEYLEKNKGKLALLGAEMSKADGTSLNLEKRINNLFKAYTKQDQAGKEAIVRLAAEGRSRGIMATLLKNQDVYMAMQKETYGAAGSAAIEYSLIMDTTKEKMARLNATIDRFASASNVTNPIGEMVDSFDALLRAVLAVNDAAGSLFDTLNNIPGKITLPIPAPGGAQAGVGEVAQMGYAAGTSAFIKGPAVAPGRMASALDVAGALRPEIIEAKSAKERMEAWQKHNKEVLKALLGIESTPETKSKVAMKKLLDNREQALDQTKQDMQVELQAKAAYMEMEDKIKKEYEKKSGKELSDSGIKIAMIKEMGKLGDFKKSTIKTMIEEENAAAKLAGIEGLSKKEIQKIEDTTTDLTAATNEYSVGLISAAEYQKELNKALKILPEGSEEWIKTLQASKQQMAALIQSRNNLAKAAAEFAGTGELESAIMTQRQATDEYNRIKKLHKQNRATEEELNNAKAASYQAGAAAKESRKNQIRAEEELSVAFAKSGIEIAEKELRIAINELSRANGKIEKDKARKNIEDKRRALIDAQIARQNLLLDVAEAGARTEQASINIAFQRASILAKAAYTWEQSQQAVIMKEEAIKRQEEYNKSLAEARFSLSLASKRKPLERVQMEIQHAYKMLALEKDAVKKLGILAKIEDLRLQQHADLHDLEKAVDEAREARILEPLEKARAELQRSEAEVPWVRNMEGEAAALRQETANYEKAKQLRMDYYTQEKSILEMRRELGEITVQQQIEATIALARSVEMTREQTYQLRTELKRLQEESEAEKRESFNLPDIALPTMYEIKRSLQGGYYQQGGGYNDNREVNIFISRDVDMNRIDEALGRNNVNIYQGGKTRGLVTRRY